MEHAHTPKYEGRQQEKIYLLNFKSIKRDFSFIFFIIFGFELCSIDQFNIKEEEVQPVEKCR